jgi:drug/metabolite transporter (DMT)-like permease
VVSEPSEIRRDWVSSYPARLVAWDLPTVAIIGAAFAGAPVRTVVWTVALTWMGIACLANARRCGRRHCHYTGPFFLIMALASLLYGYGVLPLGPQGWLWLGGTLIVVGYGVLWYVPERLWGKFVVLMDLDDS